MKKLIIFFAVFLFGLNQITPFKKIKYDYYISKIAFNKKYLIAGLENGSIVIKDVNSLKTIRTLNLPKIHDFMGDLIAMPIYSLDIINNKVLILAEGEEAKRELFIYNIKTKKLSHIFTSKKTFMKANFIDENNIFFGLLSDAIALFNLKEKKWIFNNQIGNYVFSTYALNNKKTKAAIGDESGNITIVDTKTGKKLKVIIGDNKDKTLAIDYQKNLILNASSDKIIAVYKENGKNILTIKSKFLPYAASLNPNLKEFATQFDEKNNIIIYSFNKKPLFILKGHSMPLNEIKYLNKTSIISFSPAEIIIWKGVK